MKMVNKTISEPIKVKFPRLLLPKQNCTVDEILRTCNHTCNAPGGVQEKGARQRAVPEKVHRCEGWALLSPSLHTRAF